MAVGKCALHFAPDCFAGLTKLATLDLPECRLAKIPAALTALEGSLTSLVLTYAEGLELAHDDVTILLALRNLRKLDIRRRWFQLERAGNAAAAELRGELIWWNRSSMARLVDLPIAFYEQHGHKLTMIWDDEDSEEGRLN